MGLRTLLVYHSPGAREIPSVLESFAAEQGLTLGVMPLRAEVEALVNRSFPLGLVLEEDGTSQATQLCLDLKRDAFSGIVPVVIMADHAQPQVVQAALEAGADEVLTSGMSEREQTLRLHMMLQRADRDVSVHPTTRLPGTPQIERDMAERIRTQETFAVCYADLDHFKEFNDRYGYNEGDRVIRVLARILRDVVKGHHPEAFIGHIGGDDFIFNVGLDHMTECCEEIIEVFDTLIPFQYNEEDRRAGYFLGRDRRGNILWVPLMTLSIGVVTNQVRTFTHTARVSELATEMKTFAKKLPGSVYAVDRRSDEPGDDVRVPLEPEQLEASTEP